MNQSQIEDFVPTDMQKEFIKYLKNVCPEVQQSKITYDLISPFYQKRDSLKSDDGTKEQLMQLGLENEAQAQAFINYWITLSEVSQRLRKVLVENKVDLAKRSKNFISQTMFDIFSRQAKIDGKKFCQHIKIQFTTSIPNEQKFLKAIDEGYKQYKKNEDDLMVIGRQIIQKEIPSSNNYESKYKEQVSKCVEERIKAIDETKWDLIDLGMQNEENAERLVFEIFTARSHSSENSGIDKNEPEKEFKERVLNLLEQKFRAYKNKTMDPELLQQFLKSLFNQSKSLSYAKIFKLIQNQKIRELKGKQQNIKILICQIYQLKSQSELTYEKPQQKGAQNYQGPIKAERAQSASNISLSESNKSKRIKSQLIKNYSQYQEMQQQNQAIAQQSSLKLSQIENNMKSQKLMQLKQELKKIQEKTKGNSCIDSQIRKLEISLIQQNQDQTKISVKELQNSIKDYQLDPSLVFDLEKLNLPGISKASHSANFNKIKKEIEILNMVQIEKGSRQIEEQDHEDLQNCLVFLGSTGAGKTTLNTGCQGHKLKEIKKQVIKTKTKNQQFRLVYEAQNQQVGKKNKISSNMISGTKHPKISVVNPQWTKKINLKIIDNGGFEDTRGQEMDILNNLGTRKIIKKVKKARFIIVIPKDIMDSNGKVGRTLAAQIQKYFEQDIQYLQDHFYFVLTKGLTSQQLLGRVIEITSVSSHGSKFFTILRKKLEILVNKEQRIWQISNPSTHKFDKLVKHIIKHCEQKANPGTQMDTSFSSKSEILINSKKMLLVKLIKACYQKGDPALQYYLEHLRTIEMQLQEQKKSQNYKGTIEQLKDSQQKKKRQWCRSIDLFIQKNDPQYLQKSNDILKNLRQMAQFSRKIFGQEQSPLEWVQQKLEEKLKQAEQTLKTIKQQKSQTTLKAQLYLLKYYSKDKHQQTVKYLLKKEAALLKKIKELTREQNIQEIQWKENIETYKNLFIIQDGDKKQSRQQNIYKVIQRDLEQANYEKQIFALLKKAKKQEFRLSLKETVDKYFTKLTLFREIFSHYQYIQQMNKLKLDCIEKISQQSALITATLQKTQDLTVQQIKNINVYLKNSSQIFDILDKHKKGSTLNSYRRNSSGREIFELIKHNFDIKTRDLQNTIREVLKPPYEQIDTNLIKQKFQNFSKLLNILKKLKNDQDCSSSKQEKKKQAHLFDELFQVLESSEKALAKIINLRQSRCSNQQILHFQINYQLLGSLIILTAIQGSIADQNLSKKSQNICDSIITKMKKPLKNLVANDFKEPYDFQEVYLLLEYLQQLQAKNQEYSIICQEFNPFINYINDQDLNKILLKMFEEIKVLFSQINDFISKEDLDQMEEEFIPGDKISNSNINKAINYIKKYDLVEQICQKYANKGIKAINKYKNQIGDWNLQKVIQTKLSFYTESLQIYENMVNQQSMKELRKNVNSLIKILNDTKKTETIQRFRQIKSTIKEIIDKLHQDWQSTFNQAKEHYQQFQPGEDFSKLKLLLSQRDSKQIANRSKIQTLFSNIIRKINAILQQIFIDTNQQVDDITKVDAFQSVFTFKDLCKEEKIQNKDIRVQLLTNNCKALFNGFFRSFEDALQKVQQKGSSIFTQKELRMIQARERRLGVYLKKEYQSFLKERNIQGTLFEDFTKKCKMIEQNFKKFFFDDKLQFKPTDKLNGYYEAATANPKIKAKLEKKCQQYTSKESSLCDEFLKSSHASLDRKVMQLQKQIINMPYNLSEPIKKKIQLVKKQKSQFEKNVKQNSQKQLKSRNPKGILQQLKTATKFENKTACQASSKTLKNYFKQQVKVISFDNQDSLKELFGKNLALKKDKDVKQLLETNQQVKQEIQLFQVQCKKITKKEILQSQQAIQNRTKNLIDDFNTKYQQDLPFNIHENNKPEENPSVNKLITVVNVCDTIPQLKEEAEQAKATIDKLVTQSDKNMDESINIMDILAKNVGGNGRNDSLNSKSRINFKKQLKKSCLYRSQYKSHLPFNRVTGLKKQVDEKKLAMFEQKTEGIKSTLVQKYKANQKYSIRDALCNDSEERVRQKINNIADEVLSIKNYAKYFMNNNEIPNNPQQCIKKIYKEQFQLWQRQIKQAITQIFQNKSNNDKAIQEIRTFNHVMEIFDRNSFSIIPDLCYLKKQVHVQLSEYYKKNSQRLNEFCRGADKYNQYQKYTTQLNEIAKKYDQQTKDIKERQKQQNKKLEDQQNQNMELLIKKIPQQTQNKAQAQESIRKQCQSAKNSRKNDIQIKCQEEIRILTQAKEKNEKMNIEQFQIFLEKQFCDPLVIDKIAKLSFDFQRTISNCNKSTSDYLSQAQKKYKKSFFKYVYNNLNRDTNNFAHFIKDQEKAFDKMNKQLYHQLVSGKTFEELVNLVPEISQKKKKLALILDRYKQYNTLYDSMLDQYRNSSNYEQTKKSMISKCINLGQKVGLAYNSKKSDGNRSDLIAMVYALWTIIQSNIDEDNVVVYTYRPHVGQILAIFLLLELDEQKPKANISRAMVECKTGQGKSVILGVLSAYLALTGFEVYQACYSQYLSSRDYQQFKAVFEALEVQNLIHYNVFSEICKKMLKGNPKQMFPDKNKGKKQNKKTTWESLKNCFSFSNQSNKRKKIMLVDEADVFINEEFLGKNYYPSTQIRRQCINKLLDFLWSKRANASALGPSDITESQQFKAVCDEFNNQVFTKIMKNQVNDMIRGLSSFNQDRKNRTVKDNKIYYREGDGLSDKIHFGYRTIFAYYYEYHQDNKSIDLVGFENQRFINLIVASFSYSKLPEMFDSILGVTGTLKAMSESQLKILRDDYKVNRLFLLPSIYPQGNRKVTFQKVNSLNLFKSIVESAQKEYSKGRPVIIFFRTKADCYSFLDYQEFQQLRKDSKATEITYEIDPSQRNFRIKVATFDSKITIMTMDFGRGTDFKLPSNKKDHQGLHIISAYMPDSYCDYIQLIGRVARQGGNGTALINIIDEEQDQHTNTVISQEESQKQIKEKDNQNWEIKMDHINRDTKISIQEHNKTEIAFKNNSSQNEMLEHIYSLNEVPQIMSKKSRTVILIDATASMSPVFRLIVEVVKESLTRMHETQRQQNSNANIEIQICIYRNYNSSANMILQHSSFELTSDPLNKWISKTQVSGGWGNEAVEVALQFVNSEEKIDQVIIIGDAPGNTDQEVKYKRKHFENVWKNQMNFPQTNTATQLAKMKQQKIKIHSFYLQPQRTKKYFDHLSSQTGGQSEEFKIQDKNATDLFTNFISKRILENLSQKTGCPNLIANYKKSYSC